MSEFERAVREFVAAFDVVFQHDWNYTKQMLGTVNDEGTFLRPGLEDEFDDWWARGILLDKYRHLLTVMEKKAIAPIVSPELQRVLTEFRDRSR